jgi:membrane-bound lytic murein transglycosylase D
MVRLYVRSAFRLALLPALAGALSACGPELKAQKPVVAPTAPPPLQASAPPPPAVPEDPVVALIAGSERLFKAGERELERGHVEAARQEFNRSLEVLLESPYGGRTEPRVREHFDRLVDRISTYELKALTVGDGFTEKKYEEASIDSLLALSTTFATEAPADSLATVVQSDLQNVPPDIDIPLNQSVLSYIELFQGRLHDFIEEGLRRGAKYLPMIQGVFRAEGLPLDLAYVPLIESAFKPNALSRAQAKGVWQFMTGTALENGLRRDWYIDERSDPEKATVAAAKYLKTLSNLFSGDWHLALASYNVGPGRMQKAMKQGRADDFWQLASKPRLLPRETREYVPMILAAIVIARNPAQYGFEIESESTQAFDHVTLTRPVDLRRVAEWTGTSVDAIQALNPELRRWTTPLKDDQYELKVPAGTAEQVAAQLDDAPPVEVASLNWYTVKRGETMTVIARKLGVSRADLAEANYLAPAARVTAGQKLIVPRETSPLMAASTERTVPVADSRPISAEPQTVAEGSTGSDRVKIMYEVKQGDTLSSIARLFKTTVASLRSWNKIPDNRIAAGTRLVVWVVRGDRNAG